jgi:hypothetical protein
VRPGTSLQSQLTALRADVVTLRDAVDQLTETVARPAPAPADGHNVTADAIVDLQAEVGRLREALDVELRAVRQSMLADMARQAERLDVLTAALVGDSALP